MADIRKRKGAKGNTYQVRYPARRRNPVFDAVSLQCAAPAHHREYGTRHHQFLSSIQCTSGRQTRSPGWHRGNRIDTASFSTPRTPDGVRSGTESSQTRRWSKGDSNPRSLPLDFLDEGQVHGGVGRTSIKMFPNRSRFAVEPGGTTQVESYSSMMQGPALGTRRSERFMIAVSHQPWSGPK